jgi:hypothetical protein
MRSFAFRLLLVVTVTALVALLDVGRAEAHTCSSACNQIRRACVHVTKATKKIAYAACDADRDTCRVDCEANADTCTVVCDGALAACSAACLADPDPVACDAACVAARAECPLECPDCCNYGRASCRESARATQREARAACTDSRLTCRETCVDPIDGPCVRGCKSVQRDCQRAAKNLLSACKRGCAKGTERRACIRTCRSQVNAALQLCSSQEVLCVGGCIGITP